MTKTFYQENRNQTKKGVIVMMRHKMSRKGSKKYFTRHASVTHGKNIRAVPMRGGFRI